MRTFTQHDRLTDAEFDRLADFLKSCTSGKAMNVERLDGFFAALIAGPEIVMPSEYYPEVFGGEMSDTDEFDSLDEANEILGLLMRHWNTIAGTLLKGDVYVPLLIQDDNGVAKGNDWARGFMRGMGMRHDGWAELVNGNDAYAFRLTEGQHLPFFFAIQQVVMILHGNEASPAVKGGEVESLRELPGIHRRGSDITDLAGFHHIVQSFQRLFDWCLIIPAVNLVKVYIVGLQSAQAPVEFVKDSFARKTPAVRFVAHDTVEFGSDDGGFATNIRLQKSAEHLLTGSPLSRRWPCQRS